MRTPIETTIDSYDATAPAYAEKTFGIDTAPQRSAFLSYLPPNASILDVGCGPGRDTKLFADVGHSVTGIDLSARLLAIARAHAPSVDFRQMDLRRLRFPDSSFDGVWVMSVLMHLEKKEFLPAVAECSRVLKQDGVLYFCLKRGTGEGLEEDARYGGVQKYFAYYQEADVRLSLAKTGLSLLATGAITGDVKYATAPWMDFYLRKER